MRDTICSLHENHFPPKFDPYLSGNSRYRYFNSVSRIAARMFAASLLGDDFPSAMRVLFALWAPNCLSRLSFSGAGYSTNRSFQITCIHSLAVASLSGAWSTRFSSGSNWTSSSSNGCSMRRRWSSIAPSLDPANIAEQQIISERLAGKWLTTSSQLQFMFGTQAKSLIQPADSAFPVFWKDGKIDRESSLSRGDSPESVRKRPG
jgi:hypothetical protein